MLLATCSLLRQSRSHIIVLIYSHEWNTVNNPDSGWVIIFGQNPFMQIFSWTKNQGIWRFSKITLQEFKWICAALFKISDPSWNSTNNLTAITTILSFVCLYSVFLNSSSQTQQSKIKVIQFGNHIENITWNFHSTNLKASLTGNSIYKVSLYGRLQYVLHKRSWFS